MDIRNSLIVMLRQLLEDMNVLHQQGAGYYSCLPIINRYNKLLEQAKIVSGSDNSLMNTFDEQEEDDPKDPAYKMKIVQAIRIEVGQLISLLESSQPSDEEGAA